MASDLSSLIRGYTDAHADHDGFAPMPIEGLGAIRAFGPTGLVKSIYKPLVCLVLQGAKQVMVGPDTHDITAGQSVVINADVPAISRVVRASRVEPYLALAVEFDAAVLLDLAGHLGCTSDGCAATSAVLVDATDEAVADCALRLVRLLGRPDAIPVLRPSILRELHYWMLAGRHGAAIRGLARADGAAHRIARAVAVLRGEYTRPLRVLHLAAVAGMSASTFHHHFRAVTSLSPIQFQKQLRLIEARRRLRGEGLPASRAAFEVGYESVSQFTREYARMFGVPPGRDKSERRAAQEGCPVSPDGSEIACMRRVNSSQRDKLTRLPPSRCPAAHSPSL